MAPIESSETVDYDALSPDQLTPLWHVGVGFFKYEQSQIEKMKSSYMKIKLFTLSSFHCN